MWAGMTRKKQSGRSLTSCIACAFRKRVKYADASTQTMPTISDTDHLFLSEKTFVPVQKTDDGKIWYDMTAISQACPTLTDDLDGDTVRDGRWWCPADNDHPLLNSLLKSDEAPFFFRWINAERSFGVAGEKQIVAKRTRQILHIFEFAQQKTVSIANPLYGVVPPNPKPRDP